MTEPFIIALLVASVLLWTLGGTFWKGFRRYVWPFLAGFLLIFSGVNILTGIGVMFGLAIVNSLPYGDNTPELLRPLVFITLMLPALAIHLGVWPMTVVFGGLLTGAFYASRKWTWVTWKLVEGLAGFFQAAALVMASLHT